MAQKGGLLFLSIILMLNCGAQVNNTYNLMPVPAELNTNDNRVRINDQFNVSVIGSANPRIYAEASRFVRRLSNKTGIFLDKIGFVTQKDSDATAKLLLRVGHPGRLTLHEDESYSIETLTSQVDSDSLYRFRSNSCTGNLTAIGQYRRRRILFSRRFHS